MTNKQECQRQSSQILREFIENDAVYVKNFAPGPRWLPGVVTRRTGPLSYVIRLANEREVRRHVDHVKRSATKVNVPDLIELENPAPIINAGERPKMVAKDTEPPLDSEVVEKSSFPDESTSTLSIDSEQDVAATSTEGQILRRSTRSHQRPEYFGSNIYDGAKN